MGGAIAVNQTRRFDFDAKRSVFGLHLIITGTIHVPLLMPVFFAIDEGRCALQGHVDYRKGTLICRTESGSRRTAWR